MRNVNRSLIGKPEGKRPLGTSRHTWKDNIKMNIIGIIKDVACVHVAQYMK
jgi:hypothetical protein